MGMAGLGDCAARRGLGPARCRLLRVAPASAAAPVRFSVRRLLAAMLLGVLVYAAFVFYAGYRQMALALAGFEWSALGLALCLSSTNYALRFLKWQYYLRRLDVRGIRTGDSALIFLSGFVLSVTPGKVGEVFKSAVLARTHGVPLERTAPIVVAERLTDVIAIVLLVVIGSLGFGGGLYLGGHGRVLRRARSAGDLVGRAGAPLLCGARRRAAPGELGAAADTRLRELARGGLSRRVGVPGGRVVRGWGLEGIGLHAAVARLRR